MSAIVVKLLFLISVQAWTLNAGAVFAQSAWSYSRDDAEQTSLRRSDLENVDLTLLNREARDCHLNLDEEDLNRLVTANFQFLFLNKINQRHFLVTPRPEKVMSQIIGIYKLNKELRDLIVEGRSLAAGQSPTPQLRRQTEDIGDRARRLKQAFEQYFLDVREASFSIRLPQSGDGSSNFIFFLVQSEKIQKRLTDELDRYFFNPVPGSIHLSDYDRVSIQVLTESLARLSKLTAGKLER